MIPQKRVKEKKQEFFATLVKQCVLAYIDAVLGMHWLHLFRLFDVAESLGKKVLLFW